MSLGRLLHKGLGVALDAPTLRALSGTAAGTLIASAAGPAYRTIANHFTLSGNDLATALSDSFSRGLTAIDDELNGWRISRALGAKLRRDYQARIRADFLEPFIAEHNLDAEAGQALCQTLNQHGARLIQARERLFPATELPEPDIAELLSTDAGGVSELLLERIEQTVEPLPEELRGFLIYRDLLGDAVLYFFRETLRRDPRVAATLNALQQAAARDPRYALWRIGKHTPEQILGAGGMGLALLVKNRLDQYRVLKLLWSDDEAAAERFHREALTMARIAGAHVPAVHDFDHADPIHHQRPYLEMEYRPDALDGEHWLQQHGPLTLAQGLAVARQVAEVLQLAHRQGIHHHDLKPANLLLQPTDDGIKVTVIDFGLSSKVIELHQRLGRGSVSGHSIMARQVFGSLDYAPPEQRGQGNQPGPWSDLYSLAITLYRLLTNAPPNPPNPFLLPDDQALQQLLFQCLHHEPEQRPTVEQFLEWLAVLGPPPRPSPLARGREQEKPPPSQGGGLEGVILTNQQARRGSPKHHHDPLVQPASA